MSSERHIAGERSYRNRFSKTHRGVLDDPARIDHDGVLGESAFARFMKIGPDQIKREGPVSANFVLRNGTRVDVRASRADYPRLIVPPAVLARGTVDVFVLAKIVKPRGKEPTVDDVELWGWATAGDMASAEAVVISNRPGATPVHALSRYALREMDELKRHHIPHTLSLFGEES